MSFIGLRFHSWFQKGLSTQTSVLSDSSGFPESIDAKVDLSLTIKKMSQEFSKQVILQNPSDVLRLDSNLISKIYPSSHQQDAEPTFFPFIEFHSPELPWLYTSAKPGEKKRLAPWLSLICLEKNEGYEVKPILEGAKKAITIYEQAGKLLPNLSEAYAWSHVQEVVVPSQSELNLDERLKLANNNFIARIICPIRLQSHKNYECFLVPSFYGGAVSGLGLSLTESERIYEPAWSTETEALTLPVFHQWSFKTGEADFEELVRRLKPYEAGEKVGTHDLNISKPQGGLNIGQLPGDYKVKKQELTFVGALKSVKSKNQFWFKKHKEAFQEELKKQILVEASFPEDRSEYKALEHDPVLTAPLYGEWQTSVRKENKEAALSKKWMEQLNLNPKHRSVAGLGCETLRNNQEQYMGIAWEKAAKAREVQQALRQARLAAKVSDKIGKRVKDLSDEAIIGFTEPMQKTMKESEKTLHRTLVESQWVPKGVGEKSFTRFAKMQERNLNRITGNQFDLLKKTQEVIAKPSVEFSQVGVATSLDSLSLKVSYEQPSSGSVSTTSKWKSTSRPLLGKISTLPIATLRLSPMIQPLATEKDFNSQEFANKVRDQVQPKEKISDDISKRINGVGEAPQNQSIRIKKFVDIEVEFENSVYNHLTEENPEFFLPGFSDLPDNIVTVLETNPKFIEAFLVGFNHEMSREMAWRQYPARLKQTWFKKFWKKVDETAPGDILPVNQWSEGLGENEADSSIKSQAVVLIKGELLKYYPNTIIYLLKAEWKQDESGQYYRSPKTAEGDHVMKPHFRGSIGQEAHFLGFDITTEELNGSDQTDQDPGWFIVFEEVVSESRFGLDASSDKFGLRPPMKISDLNWGNFVKNEEELESLKHAPLNPGWKRKKIQRILWGENSAQMARLTYQQPVRICFHGDALIPEVTND